jgi:hypothetical protein
VRDHRGAGKKEGAVKRAVPFLIAALCLAQQARIEYREAYRAWRETDPNLERDSAGGGAAIAQRADRMAAEAAKSAAARKRLLDGIVTDQIQQNSWIENSAPGPQPAFVSAKVDTQFVATEITSVTRTIDRFASDPDKGIQQLRQSLARERIALDALNLAVAERRKAADAEAAATETISLTRTKVLEQLRPMLEASTAAVADTGHEREAWAEYYRKIGEGAKGEATPITVIPPGVPPAIPNNPVPAPPTVTPVPLARYTGAWTYPPTNGLYHGAQPEFLDVLVNEENGDIKGTLVARFKLPAGSTGDAVLRFDFSGKLQATRNQVFNLVTSDGAKGTVELIPGAAFNLLEVNFQTEAKPGKIRQADVVLVKK